MREGRWTVDVRLCLVTGIEPDKNGWKRYTGKETFGNEVEAIARSLILGKEIVDREGAGVSHYKVRD